jgi:hypothetical protein
MTNSRIKNKQQTDVATHKEPLRVWYWWSSWFRQTALTLALCKRLRETYNFSCGNQ